MTIRFAFECYADQDVVMVLRDECQLPLKRRHSFGQGDVVNDLLRSDQAEIGMVDEDPLSSHHPLRDKMHVEQTTEDVEIRRRQGKRLVILKPDLEECFIRSMKRVGVPLTVARNAKELHEILNIPNHPKHAEFREQLRELLDASRAKHVPAFITDLEQAVRTSIS
jgi:hypothetical protein